MTAWTGDELARIGTADELDIAPLRPDGTLRNPVTIWVVRHGDDALLTWWMGHRTCSYRYNGPSTMPWSLASQGANGVIRTKRASYRGTPRTQVTSEHLPARSSDPRC